MAYPEDSSNRFRIRPDGTIPITCRKCGREIARRVASGQLTFSTINECLKCQGYPEEAITQQYAQLDPTKPPIPRDQFQDPVFLYPEDLDPKGAKAKTWLGVLRPMFRAMGFLAEEEVEEVPESAKIAKKKRTGGLFEK